MQDLERRRIQSRRLLVAILGFSVVASLVTVALNVSVRVGGGFFFAAGVSASTLLWMSLR